MTPRRVALLVASLLAGAAIVLASGCGGDPEAADDDGAVVAADPERTFAPMIELAADDPWRPTSARWFLERSVFGFAEDEGCDDRPIAVGRTMPELQNAVIDWIYPKGLGRGPHYDRNPYDATCELDVRVAVTANQLTRPHDPGPRAAGLRAGQGFYLDLADDARSGPREAGGARVPVYSERRDEGDSQVRLTYWTLFGMHGRPGAPGAHEGDWERVDVLLRDLGDDRYLPLAVRDTPWDAVRRVGGTHPVVRAARATHAMRPVAPGDDCSGCRRLAAWRSLADARAQLWYGFGGAWGEVGASSDTTGPLGPHGHWP